LRKKILITHEFAPFRGGVATYCAEAARAAVALGHPIEVWTPGSGGVAWEEGVRIVRLGGRPSLRLGNLLRFAAAIFQRRAALWDCRVILASVGAQLIFLQFHRLGLLRGIEAIPLFHGSEILRYEQSRSLNAPAKRWLAGRPAIFAASRHVRRLLLESGLLPAGKEVTVAPCGLRGDLRSRALAVLPAALADERPVRILTLARLHPRKGQLDTVRALAALPAAVRSGLVYQLGGGLDGGGEAYFHEVEQACRKGGVPLDYLGEIPDERLAETYAQCDLYVMSSRTLPRSVEGFGMTYLEAGAFGKPVIGYRTGGVAEAVREGESGLLVDEGDIAALSAALEKLVGDAALRQAMGEAGRAHAQARTWDEAARVLCGEV